MAAGGEKSSRSRDQENFAVAVPSVFASHTKSYQAFTRIQTFDEGLQLKNRGKSKANTLQRLVFILKKVE